MTKQTHTVIMPNGLPITDVPIGWGVPEIMEAARQSSLHDGTFVQELDSLMDDEQFRTKVFSLAPPSFSNGQ